MKRVIEPDSEFYKDDDGEEYYDWKKRDWETIYG